MSAVKRAWRLVVGLEMHIQINVRHKAFSDSLVSFAAHPNSHVTPWDISEPGTLPVLNRQCVKAGLRTALALGMTVNPVSFFDRKHYFYYDLPNGYQITQQRVPLAEHGSLRVGYDPQAPVVRLQRLHLEHDSGKSLHTHPTSTLVDLNRAGTGLMELVTEPDLSSGEDAASFVRSLILLLQSLDVCDGNLAEGSLRVDANVSIDSEDGQIKGPRVEIKNINGLRFLAKAIEFEKQRHIEVLENGEPLARETRTYDASSNVTVSMRSKEEQHDYRFMPEPDLPPLYVTEDEIDATLASLPELPQQRVDRLIDTFGIRLDEAVTLIEESGAANFYEAACQCLRSTADIACDNSLQKRMATVLVNDVFGLLRDTEQTIRQTNLQAERFVEVCSLLAQDKISNLSAKELLSRFVAARETRSAEELAQELGLIQNTDQEDLKQQVRAILAEHPDKVTKYRNGAKGLAGFFVGQLVRRLGASASPKRIKTAVEEALDEASS